MRPARTLQERFDEKYIVVHEEPTEHHDGIHWMWTAGLDKDGYGKVWVNDKHFSIIIKNLLPVRKDNGFFIDIL